MKAYSCPKGIPFGRHFRHHPLAWCLLLSVSPVWAGDYFDPGFLGEPGDNAQVDLSAFAEAGGVEAGEYTVWVFINQHSAGQYSLNFQKNDQGQIAPVLTPAQLETLGVNVKQLPGVKDMPADAPIDNIGTVIPQATTRLDLAHLRLDISVPQVSMQPDVRGAVDPSQWEDGISALMANYNLSAGRTTNSTQNQTSHNNNLFATVRAGANTGPWRLRSTMTHTRFEYSGGANQSQPTQTNTRFSNTFLSRDIRGLRSSLLVGESNTGSEIFDGVPFRGVKLSSNEQMLPSQLRGYAPAISGVANSNARVTVRQNGNVVYETYVAPGPFYINDIQQAGLSGDYDVRVTEADGTERQFIVPYSSLPVMLRPGGWKYELTAGRYDGNLTNDSRQADFMLGTAIYGLPKDITLYGGVLAAKDYQALNVGSGISLGNIGALSADMTYSSAKLDGESTKVGQSYRLRYSKSLLSTGTSIDLTALRYSTRDYYNFNEFNSQGHQLQEGVSPWTLQRRRSSFQTQISQQMGGWGTLNFRANRDDYWGGERTLTGLSLGYSNSLKGVSYGINYNIDRVKDTNGNWPENRQISFNVSIPFSIFGYSRGLQSMYATSTITHDNVGRTQNQTGLSGSTLDGRLSYSASQSSGNQGQNSNSNMNAGYQGSKGSVSGGYSYSGDTQSMNMNASGGLLIHSEGITFSRSMGESVALISAPGAAGVSVNGGSAVTDWRGYAVAPYLSDYTRNSVGLDPSSLSEGVDIAQTNLNVYPTKGAVVKARFATRVGYQVLMTLKHGSGVVPFGAVAALANAGGSDESGSIVGDGGQVYLTGLPESGTLWVKWGETSERQCRVNFNLANMTTSAEIPIRQVTYTCGVESYSPSAKTNTAPVTSTTNNAK
ncbi:fimbria/pilus outer membrane usher protein [Yersinia intermedia]|uniref:fimbria/pilus outer membrane usher protein n=1 Tax=Yersinia intermedia TaxID=631 RepID=UPI001CFD929D|nr:fimbria/pilus outer membrane usher protein [Yersinia intermedia]MCB5315721.1 fimbrial biogenesis outer membrane usher protein [Yersinia intermedia]MCB5329772.1 fimbrial biogenesis outer membrane usher protein [Yersinia intermedia]